MQCSLALTQKDAPRETPRSLSREGLIHIESEPNIEEKTHSLCVCLICAFAVRSSVLQVAAEGETAAGKERGRHGFCCSESIAQTSLRMIVRAVYREKEYV